MHVRIHVQMLHALRDSIVRLTLVKLTCPPSEEVNSLNGKECLSSTLWWHPLFPSVTLWGIITQVHSCLPGNWIWAIMMVRWGRIYKQLMTKSQMTRSERDWIRMCPNESGTAHFGGISSSVFVSLYLTHKSIFKKMEEMKRDFNKTHTYMAAEDLPGKHKDKCADQYQRTELGWVVGTYFLMGIRPSGLSCSFSRVYLY